MTSSYDYRNHRDQNHARANPTVPTAYGRPSPQYLSPPPLLPGHRSDSAEAGESQRQTATRRHSSPGEYSLTAALMSAAGGAAAAALIDKHLVQGHHHRRHEQDDDGDSNRGRSSDGRDRNHGHDHGLRRVIDLAIGGYTGLGAYNYYQDHHRHTDGDHHRQPDDGHHRRHSKEAYHSERGRHSYPHQDRDREDQHRSQSRSEGGSNRRRAR